MEKLDIFYVTSDSFAPVAGVSITSLFLNNADIEEITVYIFADSVSKENKDKFIELGKQFSRKIVIIDAKDTLNSFTKLSMGEWRGSNVAYGKAFCVDFVPESVERLIAIDSDTIILGDLRPALKYRFDDNSVIAMVKESILFRSQNDASRNAPYNSGFIIYDAKKWRTERWMDKLLWHIKNVKSYYRVADQDLLNIVCEGHITKLPPEFNFLPINRVFNDKVFFSRPIPDFYSPAELQHARESPIVIHMYRFLGSRSWQENTPHPDRELFDEYLSKSLWKNYIKEPIDKSVLFRIERIIYKILPQKMFFDIFIAVQNLEAKLNDRKDEKKADRRWAVNPRKQ